MLPCRHGHPSGDEGAQHRVELVDMNSSKTDLCLLKAQVSKDKIRPLYKSSFLFLVCLLLRMAHRQSLRELRFFRLEM